jgi:hypothetical protein
MSRAAGASTGRAPAAPAKAGVASEELSREARAVQARFEKACSRADVAIHATCLCVPKG